MPIDAYGYRRSGWSLGRCRICTLTAPVRHAQDVAGLLNSLGTSWAVTFYNYAGRFKMRYAYFFN
jgi:hypothetical protein